MAGLTLTFEEFQEVMHKRRICICRLCFRCYKKGKKTIKRIQNEYRLVYPGCELCFEPIVSPEACARSSCNN